MQGQTIAKLVTSVTGKWAKVRKAELREASRRGRRRERLYRPARTPLREIVFENIDQAIQNASGGRGIQFPKRNLFYSMRKLVQDDPEAERELQWAYFQPLLDEYEQDHGEITGLYRDPRGFLREPHTGKTVPLGTREVDGYAMPKLLFDKLLYVEKKGFLPIFEEYKIAEKYDMAIACAEGYATRAAKTLMARAEGSAVTLLCMHDADPDGYAIVQCLENATRACGFGVNVIDLGLHLGEALQMGLEPEEFYRARRLPADLAAEFGSGQRVELNDLAKDPDQFIQWVEGKLQEHGLAVKLVPPEKAILDHATETRDTKLAEAVKDQVMAMVDIDQIVEDLIKKYKGRIKLKDLPGELAKWAEKLEPSPWREHVDGQVKKRLDKIDKALGKATEKAVRDALS